MTTLKQIYSTPVDNPGYNHELKHTCAGKKELRLKKILKAMLPKNNDGTPADDNNMKKYIDNAATWIAFDDEAKEGIHPVKHTYTDVLSKSKEALKGYLDSNKYLHAFIFLCGPHVEGLEALTANYIFVDPFHFILYSNRKTETDAYVFILPEFVTVIGTRWKSITSSLKVSTSQTVISAHHEVAQHIQQVR